MSDKEREWTDTHRTRQRPSSLKSDSSLLSVGAGDFAGLKWIFRGYVLRHTEITSRVTMKFQFQGERERK